MTWGFTGAACDREAVKACVGPGWHALLDKLIDELETLGWNGTVMQVKEKFGGLRFYIGYGNPEIWDAIDRAEHKSYEICEHCGNFGRLRTTGWMLTLCDACEEERHPTT